MLKGKVALVTGASRGIGRAIALRLVAAGATVIGTATSEAGAKTITDALASVGAGAGRVLDVRDPSRCDAVIDAVHKEFGDVAILVNNVAVVRDNLALRMKDAEWDEVIETNLRSVFRLSRAAMRGMMKARWGRIVNITSVVGATGNPGQGNYAASKAGVVGMSKSLAYEVASRGITVNCIAPGFIATAMTDKLTDDQKASILAQIPAGRMGEAEEIAAAALYLASPEAAYVTGASLHVNGGMAMI